MENTLSIQQTSIFQKAKQWITKSFSRKETEAVQNHLEAKKISKFDQEDFNELAKNIRHIAFVHFGLQAPISDLAMISIVRMIKRHFDDFSQAEILDAFESCAAGEYDTEKEKLKPYGSFSVQFVGQVLNNYSRNKVQILKKLDRAKTVYELSAPIVKVSNEKVYKSIEAYYKEKQKMPIHFDLPFVNEAAYMYLLENGKVTNTDNYEERKLEVTRHLKQSLTV